MFNCLKASHLLVVSTLLCQAAGAWSHLNTEGGGVKTKYTPAPPPHQHCHYNVGNKFALLWGEAQLCLPYVSLKKEQKREPEMTYNNNPMVTYSTLSVKVTYSR